MWQHGGGTDGAPDAAGNGRHERTLQGYSRQSTLPCRRGNHADTPHVQSEEEGRRTTRTLHTRKGNPLCSIYRSQLCRERTSIRTVLLRHRLALAEACVLTRHEPDLPRCAQECPAFA